MKFFVDTANVEDIRKANDMGVICGVTTNPSLIAKEGRDFNEVIKEITSIVDGPISGEVKATTVDAEGMIKEGREIAAIHPNMVVKIPMTVEGLKAVKVLSAEGIKTNVTLIFTANQALLAARAGATYVSPFLGRLDDISQRGVDLIRDIADQGIAVIVLGDTLDESIGLMRVQDFIIANANYDQTAADTSAEGEDAQAAEGTEAADHADGSTTDGQSTDGGDTAEDQETGATADTGTAADASTDTQDDGTEN